MRRVRTRALLTVVAAVVVAVPVAFAGAADVDSSESPASVVFVDAWTNDDGTVDSDDAGDTGAASAGFDVWPVSLSSDDPTAPGPIPPRLVDDAAICTATINPADPRTVDVAINNAYPQYVCTISVIVENSGSVPASLGPAIIASDPGLEVDDITNPPLPAVLDPGVVATSVYSVRVRNSADQSTSLGFTISTTVANPPCGTAMVFGVERGTGDLYEIDPTAGTAYRLADIVDPLPSNVNSPNGLAYDAGTGRLYFSVGEEAGASSDLYFWDGTATVLAGSVNGQSAGAAMFDGRYYFVKNATDDLMSVTFDLDGLVVAEVSVHVGFAGTDTFRFGDIAFSPDGSTLFGSTLQSGSTPPTFFSLDLASGTYSSISTTTGVKLQIAYGDDGILYGQSTGTGEFFTIDPTTGTTTAIGTPSGAIDGFTDLASAPCPQSP